MIVATGFFDRNGSPSVNIKLGGMSTDAEFEAVIDTGFTGFVSMPIVQAFPLGLTLFGTTSVMFADGKSQFKLMAMGRATIGQRTESGLVILEESSKDVLVGMDFLRTFKLALWLGEHGIVLYDEEEMNRKLASVSPEPRS